MKFRLILGTLILSVLSIINVANLSAEENWTRKADMPTPRSDFATSMVNGKIYAIGGTIEQFGDMDISTVEMYDPETDTWTQKADMPTSRNTSTSVVNGKIYAIGGQKIHKRRIGPGFGYDVNELATVEMYDPVTDTWTQKADMPTIRNASTCVVDGKIYVIGGTAFSNIKKRKPWRLDTVEVYDPATDTWAEVRKMNHARAEPAISVVDRKIYVMGGMGWPNIPNHAGPFLSSIEVYNPKTNQWREIGDMPDAKSSHTASVINGKIYVIGGFFRGQGRDMKEFKTIEIYHPQTGRWTQKPNMPDSKFGHAAEVIKAKIYIFSGVGHDDAAFPTVEVYNTGEFPQSIDPVGKRLETWATLKNIE